MKGKSVFYILMIGIIGIGGFFLIKNMLAKPELDETITEKAKRVVGSTWGDFFRVAGGFAGATADIFSRSDDQGVDNESDG